MPKRQNTQAEIPPITDFESCQRARAALFRRLTDQLEIFRVCPNRTCKRMRACQDERGACFRAVLRAMPDDTRRSFAYAMENRANGLDPDEAFAQAETRVARESARNGA
ncbi:hypothetical protein [Bosea beijingensis]|uniref:hypothetical protein n=1 Tax=Bosea beijingensis TaxID=3068632 RepID=UPI002741C3D1|nr:hypothetical protein [Bosea sp. REN20]